LLLYPRRSYYSSFGELYSFYCSATVCFGLQL
jgi:hypothetical protein